jgi:hypothetical protein
MVWTGREVRRLSAGISRCMNWIELRPSEQPKSASAIVSGSAAKRISATASSSHGSAASIAAHCGAELRS